MKVKDLKKAINGLDDNVDVYIADHDHADWEVNSLANTAELIDHYDFRDEIDRENEKRKTGEKVDIITRPYLVIRP